MRKLILFLLLFLLVAFAAWALLLRRTAPKVPFTKATRQVLTSVVTTNGKVEPIEWAAVRAEASGPVQTLHVERGQTVVAGQLLVTINSSQAQSELSAAQSRITQAQAELETLQSGGRAAERADIENGIASARAELANTQKIAESLRRLVAKKAATQAELTLAESNVQKLELQIQAFERRRTALVSPPETNSAQARLAEAESGANAARQRIATSQIRSPIAGSVYALEARLGAFLNPGDLVANVGRLERLRVIVYVDEPELGRVKAGMPVAITWDAIPGRVWKGTVDKVPLQVQPMGTRQVGEVSCTIENPDLSLIPGTNINAEIESRVVKNALTIAKEALRRQGETTGVLKLVEGRVIWQPIRTGATSVTRVEVTEGLQEGDLLALPIDEPLESGNSVQPVFISDTAPAK